MTVSTPKVSLISIAADLGNRYLKIFSRKTGLIQIIPSYVLQIPDWQDDIAPSKTSIVIDIEDQKYVIGSLAKELGASPVFEQDKTELAKLLVLAAIEPREDGSPVIIEKLKLCLPDSRHKQSLANLKTLESVGHYYKNGEGITYTIRNVAAYDECLPAFNFVKKTNQYRDIKRVNGVIDAGGGTLLARLFSPEGRLLREADVVSNGSFALARAIAVMLTPKLGYTPNLAEIMDAIEAGNYELGTTGCNFAKEFETARSQWITQLRAKLKTSWQPWQSQLGQVAITGGSAPLFNDLAVSTGNRFFVAKEPQVSTLKGLLEM